MSPITSHYPMIVHMHVFAPLSLVILFMFHRAM